MANTLNNTLNKIGDAIESVLGTKKTAPHNDPNRVYTGQTCLERFGMEARNTHLLRNEWKRDLQYTKTLVDAEYLIQTEFKVSSYEDRLKEQAAAADKKAAEREAKKMAKIQAKKEKNEAKKKNDAMPKESYLRLGAGEGGQSIDYSTKPKNYRIERKQNLSKNK